jgi:NitT/TauT family transport system permease protein
MDSKTLKLKRPASSVHRRWRISPTAWQALASTIVAVVLWEALARFVNNPLFLTSLPAIAKRAVELWSSGELQVHVWVSFVEFAGGFLLATVLGILFGVGMAASRTARGFFDPWVSMLYATPILALGPLFILWLGIGVGSKIAIIFLTAVFPILINTLVGLTTTDRILLDVARSLGANPLQIYTKVRMPAALPFIIAGLRLSVARALVGVVVAELFGARAGLGFLILSSAQSFDTAALFVGVFILAIAGILSVSALKWTEQALAPWRFKNVEE